MRQAWGGVVVAEYVGDDGQEAADGGDWPPPAGDRAGRSEGEGAVVDQRCPPGEVGLAPAGGRLAPADARVHELLLHEGVGGVGGGRRVRPRVVRGRAATPGPEGGPRSGR